MSKNNNFPLWFWFKLPLNMAGEVLFLYKLREYYDGVTFFELVVNTDFYEVEESDYFHNHNPQLQFRLIILNWTIFDVSFYNRGS